MGTGQLLSAKDTGQRELINLKLHGDTLMTVGSYGKLKVWDLRDMNPQSIGTCLKDAFGLAAWSIHLDDTKFAFGSNNNIQCIPSPPQKFSNTNFMD